MVEADRVRGYIGPVQPEEPEKESEVDAERFKKIMRVDESDESQQKQKRRLTKNEEEGDEEETIVPEPPTPNASKAFIEYLDDKEKVDSLFDVKGKKKVPLKAEKKVAPSPYKPSVKRPPIRVGEEEVPLPPPPAYEGPAPARAPEAPPPAPPPTDESLMAGRAQKGAFKKPKAAISKEEVAPAKTEVEKKGIPSKKRAIPLPKEPTLPSKVAKEEETIEATLEQAEALAAAFEEKEKTAAAGIALPGKAPPEEKGAPSPEKKITAAEQAAAIAAGATVAAETPISATTPSEISVYSTLPPKILELFDHMIGNLRVEQYGDIRTTTVTLQMEDEKSIFNGVELIIDHYSTAPNEFNIKLTGSPEAIALFAQYSDDLAAAFAEKERNFKVNLLRPTIQPKYRKVQRKGGAGGGRGKS